MTQLDEMLAARQLPALTDADGHPIHDSATLQAAREHLRQLLAEEEYGQIPPRPDHLRVELISEDTSFCAGKAPLRTYRFTATFGEKECHFPVRAAVPVTGTPCPAFVHINFRPDVPDRYQPTEEIIDRGYAVFSFCYLDVASDDDNFRTGCAPLLGHGRRRRNAPGKLAMWAWAAMRVMDYLQTLPEIDCAHVAVVGHSRLGKTALLTAAYDDRFCYAISNDSGCSGAAIHRGKGGEDAAAISRVFPFWFCPRFNETVAAGRELPFDQHALLALIVPRHILIGSAVEDLWADPASEFLNLYQTNALYRLYGMRGLVTPDAVPTPKTVLAEGESCYQLRYGKHYFSREDWQVYMDYLDTHR